LAELFAEGNLNFEHSPAKTISGRWLIVGK
jgi:hypothetical protein